MFTYLIMVLHRLQRNAGFVASVENDLILHYWKVVEKCRSSDVHHVNVFDQEDKGERITQQFKAAGRTEYQHMQPICVKIIQQFSLKLHGSSFVVGSSLFLTTKGIAYFNLVFFHCLAFAV